MHVTFIVTGGTIFQTKDPATGCMVIGASLDNLISPEALLVLGVSSSRVVDLKVRSGADLTYDTIFAARDAVRECLKELSPAEAVAASEDDDGKEEEEDEEEEDKQEEEAETQSKTLEGTNGDNDDEEDDDEEEEAQGRGRGKRPAAAFVLVTGTDTLEEFAFCLDLLLGGELVGASASLVVTGAMKPYDIEGYDGRSNLQQAVQVATSSHAAQFGVLAVLNDDIHLARYVRKADSQLMGAFRSHPGPVGQIRSGRVRFYYGPPPDAASWRDSRLAALHALDVRPYGSRVVIWVTGVGSDRVPEALLSDLAGLVVAAPGTGSLSAALMDQLAAWTARLPVVLTSRCGVGLNFDDHYYRGSRVKYESRGFLLSGGFSQLGPVQARCLLVLRLAAGLHPRFGVKSQEKKSYGVKKSGGEKAAAGGAGSEEEGD